MEASRDGDGELLGTLTLTKIIISLLTLMLSGLKERNPLSSRKLIVQESKAEAS